MGLKKLMVQQKDDIPKEWEKQLVILWVEDDAPVPDKESTLSAFMRITGMGAVEVERPIHEIDAGDAFFNFYRWGWVKAVTCDGGWVGVLVRRKKEGEL